MQVDSLLSEPPRKPNKCPKIILLINIFSLEKNVQKSKSCIQYGPTQHFLPQPAQARASPAARPPPGGSIPASPGPLRGAREGSHPQPPLARGRLGPQLAKQRQWRWRPEKARRRRRRGHAASRPSMGLSGTASPSLAPRRGARGRRTANPGRPRAGAQWRPASAPRGALGLGVRLPERRGPTSPGRPRGRAGPGGAGAGRPRVEPLRPPAARPHLGGPGPGFPPGPAGLTPAASGPGSVLECY